MLRFALFGAGRIGKLHADNLAANPAATLTAVYDVNEAAARQVAEKHSVPVATDVESILEDGSVQAVVIASSTDTHVDLLTAAVRAGKAVFCEKPIDLDIDRVNRCREALADCDVPVQIGFNQRFDPTHSALAQAVQRGEVGQVEQLVITSRDPGPPPAAYLKVSGGIFRDMMIHDFDLARFLIREEFVTVSAIGSALVDPQIASLGDVDTAMVVMQTSSGAQCHINCSRRAVYGYDQRVEVFGSEGMLRSENRRATELVRYTAAATEVRDPLLHFFLDRYPVAYMAEIDDFIETVSSAGTPSVTFEDGRRALLLADAAQMSLQEGRAVSVCYD